MKPARSMKSLTRREFDSSALGMAALFGASSDSQGQEEPVSSSVSELQPTRFTFGSVYTADEATELVRRARGLAPGSRVGLPFWWDKAQKILVNPVNVPFDQQITPGDYQLASEILNFRAARKDVGDVWKKLTNNAQININASSVTQDGDQVDWILMTGIDIASGIFAKGGNLATVKDNNRPTNVLRPAEAIVFKKGICNLAVTINAQKKKSFWDRLLSFSNSFANSAVFGVLPLPALYQTATKTFTALLTEIQKQHELFAVISSRCYAFKLYSGATNSNTEFNFRPGRWVVIDSVFASAHMDANKNLPDIYLDIPGLLFEVKNRKTNAPVDTTYTVVDFNLTPIQRPATSG